MNVNLAVWNRGISDVLNRFRGSGTSTALALVLEQNSDAVVFVANENQRQSLARIWSDARHETHLSREKFEQILPLSGIAKLMGRKVGPILFDTTAIQELLLSNLNEIESLRSENRGLEMRLREERSNGEHTSQKLRWATEKVKLADEHFRRWEASRLYRVWSLFDYVVGVFT